MPKAGNAVTMDVLKKFCNYNMPNDSHDKIDTKKSYKNIEETSDCASARSSNQISEISNAN